METRANYILVGLFTLMAGVAALIFTLWMTGAGIEREVNYYDVLFREAVSGLSVGSPVQYSGIRVGEVERLTLDPLDPRIVRARIQVSSDVPVKVDTVARRTLLNITGASAIDLGEGLPESPLLTVGTGVPVIEATPSSLAQLQVTSEEILLSTSTLLDRANSLLSEENAQRISIVLDDVAAITTALTAQQYILQKGLEGLAQNSHSLAELLDHTNEQLSRYEEPVLEGIVSAIEELQQNSRQLNIILAENSPALAAGMQGFAELGPAMRELRGILSEIDSVTRRISDNPAGFVLGTDNIQEYRP